MKDGQKPMGESIVHPAQNKSSKRLIAIAHRPWPSQVSRMQMLILQSISITHQLRHAFPITPVRARQSFPKFPSSRSAWLCWRTRPPAGWGGIGSPSIWFGSGHDDAGIARVARTGVGSRSLLRIDGVAYLHTSHGDNVPSA